MMLTKPNRKSVFELVAICKRHLALLRRALKSRDLAFPAIQTSVGSN